MISGECTVKSKQNPNPNARVPLARAALECNTSVCVPSHPGRLFASTHPTKSRRQLTGPLDKSLFTPPGTPALPIALSPSICQPSVSDPSVSTTSSFALSRPVKSSARAPSLYRKKSPSESPRHFHFPSADHVPYPRTQWAQHLPTTRLGLGNPKPTFMAYAANLPLLGTRVSSVQNSTDARTCRLLTSLFVQPRHTPSPLYQITLPHRRFALSPLLLLAPTAHFSSGPNHNAGSFTTTQPDGRLVRLVGPPPHVPSRSARRPSGGAQGRRRLCRLRGRRTRV